MFYIKKFYTALDFIVLQKHNNNLAGHSCGVMQTPQHINLASLRGVENRRGLDRAKGHLIVHKCETQSLIIILYGWKSYSHRISLLAITLENNLQSWLRSDIGQQFLRSVLSPFLKNKTTMLLPPRSSPFVENGVEQAFPFFSCFRTNSISSMQMLRCSLVQ